MIDTQTLFNNITYLSNNFLDSLDTSFIENFSQLKDIGLRDNWPIDYFHFESGKEHYRLLISISELLDNEIIFDIGTNRCMSALALSKNETNLVKSYDIVQQLPNNPNKKNIDFFIGDATLDNDLNKSRFIFLDVDHDGVYEDTFYNHLKKINWKGILVLDDIQLNEPMKNFWNNISENKINITNIGHWSGTGIVYFE